MRTERGNNGSYSLMMISAVLSLVLVVGTIAVVSSAPVEITKEEIEYIRSVYDEMDNNDNNNKERYLSKVLLRAWKEDDIKVQWDECVNKDVKECIAIMEKDFQTHPFRFLIPEVHVPRDEEDFKKSYNKVGISVNLLNEVTGDKNLGEVCYPYEWDSVSNGPEKLDCWDCSGLRGDKCCKLIEQSTAGNYDTNGQRIECFIYQDFPTPDVSRLNPQKARLEGYIAREAPYYIMKYNADHELYVKLDMPAYKINEFRTLRRAALVRNLRTLEEIIFETKRSDYDDFAILTRELALNTSPLLSVQNLISELDLFLHQHKGDKALKIYNGTHIYDVLKYMVELIVSYLENGEQFFTPIHILTTGKGLVLAPPKLGGKLLQIQKFRPLDPEH